MLSVPVYYSWRHFECRYAFDAYAPALFNKAGLMEAPNGGFGIVVTMFNPTNPRSARYNPLLELRKGLPEIFDAQSIADILVDFGGALDRRSQSAITTPVKLPNASVRAPKTWLID